jgi:hypothetical protein
MLVIFDVKALALLKAQLHLNKNTLSEMSFRK